MKIYEYPEYAYVAYTEYTTANLFIMFFSSPFGIVLVVILDMARKKPSTKSKKFHNDYNIALLQTIQERSIAGRSGMRCAASRRKAATLFPIRAVNNFSGCLWGFSWVAPFVQNTSG